MTSRLSIGVMPLTDAAPLVVARRLGFFAEAGLDVELVLEQAWSSLRDKLLVGVLDAAQMLAPLPIDMTFGSSHAPEPMAVLMTLSRHGNAITVSRALAAEMRAQAGDVPEREPARRLRAVIEARAGQGAPRLRLGVVFHVSTHHYQLRRWLASGGIDPSLDVEIVVLPPPRTAEALRSGKIDGFCVGEPWNQIAVRDGLGEVLVTSDALTAGRSEKVLAMTSARAAAMPEAVVALRRAVDRAQRWLEPVDNRLQAARLLVEEGLLAMPFEMVASSLIGVVRDGRSQRPLDRPLMHVFPCIEPAAERLGDVLFWAEAMHEAGHLDPMPDPQELAALCTGRAADVALHNK